MTLLDYFVNIPTPKLQVPTTGGIEPTWEGRTSWFVDPFQDNPWWIPLAAFFPALLATILIFMDHQITVVIVNRKENKNKVFLFWCFVKLQ